MRPPFKPLCFLAPWLLFPALAVAQDPIITWPSGWQIEVLPQASAEEAAKVFRQRAVKSDAGGTPLMVMELTMTQVQSGHQVNLQAVLLEMRKSVQKDFGRGGYQSVCTRIHDATLSRLAALETTCTITENGRHVLSQTLVAAVDGEKAYVLSYAGQAAVYAESQEEIREVRSSLKL
ncbi:DUF4946 domain-containing protein [Pseudomonas chlororaphis]|uniref:DUF4946 domain-containing protein n=1 Tax=Pseudomonas chlororaphis TaxID=587753 RepID=A0A1Q8EPE7_9PSED|nr:DUF4946 domain-containing protein [Pseudomonas chlororaphis]OLF53668.1 DUF4946 domain-containing protein [Pseudomonas chlororaphis]